MSEITYYQRNRDLIINRANIIKITKNYCENKQKINIDHYQKMKKI